MKTFSSNVPSQQLLAAALVAILLAAPGPSSAQAGGDEDAHGEIHWGYENENGPARWGSLQSEWALCEQGRSQSPIDLASPVERELPAIALRTLSDHAVEVLNQNDVLEELDNGHTVQVNALLPGALRIEGKIYSLQQFHFHSPSEHTLNGEHLPMEIHFVNEAEDGSLAVLGVLVSAGAENAAIESLWDSLPPDRGGTSRTQLPESFARSLLAGAEDGLFHYSGSLTTPPCTEGVRWMIKQRPTELSEAQIQRFRTIYDHNNRPTNPLNDRSLYRDSSPSVQFRDDVIR